MKYHLQDIATVSGMPGLFKVLKPTRTGVVLESMDEVKKRVMAQTRHKISILTVNPYALQNLNIANNE